jgi:hypothetical protein
MFKSIKYLVGAGLFAGATAAGAGELPPEALAYAMQVCMPDYHRFCNGVPPGGGQIVQCLAARIEALSPECQRVVGANAPYGGPGQRYGDYRGPYGGSAPYAEAYRYGPAPGEGQGYPDGNFNRDRPDDERYADRGYDRYAGPPYGEGRYPDQGYNGPGYQQPGPGYPQPAPGYQQPGSGYPQQPGNYPPSEEESSPLK